MQKIWLTLMGAAVIFALAGCSKDALWQGAYEGDQDRVNWELLWHRDRINELDQARQWTPLQYAISNSYGDMAALLLKKGADPDIQSGDGRIALDFTDDVENSLMRQFIVDRIKQMLAQREAEQSESVVATAESTP